MERACARACLAVGAIASAIAVTAVGAVPGPPRDLTADLARVAYRVPVSRTADRVPRDEGRHDPTPVPSQDPTGGDRPGIGGELPDDSHEGMDDPTHDEELASHEPMDMGGHGAGPSASAAPGHGQGVDEASPIPAPAGSGGNEPAAGGHSDGIEGAHDGASGGHDDEEPAAERPRAAVLGGFVAINGIALAGAAVLRRRDGAAAALKGRRTPATSRPEEDASR